MNHKIFKYYYHPVMKIFGDLHVAIEK